MTTYAYFPGCSLNGTSKEYGASTLSLSRALGIELEELDDWSCCGATSAHCAGKEVSEALAARNVALAADTGRDLVVPCAACYNRTRRAAQAMEDRKTRERLSQIMGRTLGDPVHVLHLLELFARPEVTEKLQAMVTRPLSGTKVAAYYGCLLLRPKDTGIDDPENPTIMDGLLRQCGVEPVEWYFKAECCGASLAIPQASAVEHLVSRIITNARSWGAEMIVTACPLCQVNLETRQSTEPGTQPMPVLYFTQVLGLAVGIVPHDLCVPSRVADALTREAVTAGGE